jgi:hypothetical protein
MTYTLYRRAPGAYDLDLKGIVIGSVVKNEPPERGWRADFINPTGRLPAPFTDVEHNFLKFDDVVAWLGEPKVKPEGQSIFPG